MTDEWQEFQAYTHFPRYAAAHKRDTSFFGRFTLEMLLDMNKGFAQVFTILARGYLFHEKDGTLVHDPYDRIGYARMALCAWCSVPKNAEGTAQVDFRELHGLFPELVTADGRGWFYRHVKNVISFVKAHPNDVKKQTLERCYGMSNGFTKEWKKHVKKFQVPLYAPNTKGAWVIRFDDMIAEALAAGPLRMEEYPLPQPVRDKIAQAAPKSVPNYMIEELVRFILANQRDHTEWVNIPMANFNAFFGDTSFSKKHKPHIPDALVVFEPQKLGICRAKLGDAVRSVIDAIDHVKIIREGD